MNYKEQFKQVRSILLGLDPGLLSLYYKYFYQPQPASMEAIIEAHSKGKRPFYFLQIGGNDGFINDPIFKCVKRYPWTGIIVEPQKEVFEKRLKRTYRLEKKVILENVAIAKQSGMKKLYKLAISNARWATGLATFDRKTLESQIKRKYVDQCAQKEGIKTPARLEDYLTYEEVSCTTIYDLLQKHNFQTLNLLQIDTEGYDFEIIKTIDFLKLKPEIIAFENEHLSKSDMLKCEALLTQNGYTVQHIERDSIAYL